MTRRLLIAQLAVAAVLVVGLARGWTAGEPHYRVIVHPGNPIGQLDRDFLRDAYLKKQSQWPNGDAIRPVGLSARFAVRARFGHDVLRKSPAQLRSYWNQQIFSGKGVPPPEADTTAEVIAFVLANRGAVGYLPADVDPGGARLVGVN